MAIDRLKVALTGQGVVGNSVMNWYFNSMTALNANAVSAFLTALKSYIPSSITYTIPANGDTVNEADGRLSGGWSSGTPLTVVGTGATSFPGQAGGMVRWTTGAVVDGHHPAGRAILVPLSGNAFALTTGGLVAAFQTALATAASTFLASSSGFVVWHRPVYDRTAKPPVLKRPGSVVSPTGVFVGSTSATLRSRNH